MLSKSEISLLSSEFYTIESVNENQVTFQSRDTRHHWIIMKYEEAYQPRYMLLHRHEDIEEYHVHKASNATFAEAIYEVMRHDHRYLNNCNIIRNNNSNRNIINERMKN